MAATKLIGLGLILLFTLPWLVSASEGRRAPNSFVFMLAITGLAWSAMTGGIQQFLLSMISSTLIFVLLLTGVASAQRRWNRRLLTGGDIKLMAAAATWLHPLLAIAAIVAALVAIAAWIALKKTPPVRISRPDITPFMVVTLLAAFAVY